MSRTILDERARLSEAKLVDVRGRISEAANGIGLAGLTIFTAGSYGRLEASDHSDIDLFFTYHTRDVEHQHTKELKLFGRLIQVVEDMGFPPLSNDAQYLQTHSIDDVVDSLGGAADDWTNRFTLRMLLLLESKPLFEPEEYDKAIRRIISAYYRDFPKHQSNFEPWFLVNDIVRYWKTLLLNYENKRNRREDEERARRERVRNFKIKFSRMTTCFATLACLGSQRSPVTEQTVFEMVHQTPLQRLRSVADRVPNAAASIRRAEEEYSWFLEQTSLSTTDLEAKFDSGDGRRSMFSRADEYGSIMFDILREVDSASSSQFLRFLVV